MSIKNDHLKPRDTLLAVGDTAPDFALLDQDRKEWKLSESLRHGEVALCFVPLAFTGVCGVEMGCVSTDAAKWGKKGVTVVGISCDSFAVQKAWAEKEGYTQRLLADMHRQVCRAYGLYWPELNVSRRGTYVIERSGRVTFAEAREPGKAMDWEKVLGLLG
jgi:peroxiredoxin (alkyl hydroperoxide reductase subunit C)